MLSNIKFFDLIPNIKFLQLKGIVMRLFLGFEFAQENTLQPGLVVDLNKEQVNYALNVLRLKTGAEIEVFDGSGQAATAVLQVESKRAASLKIGAISQPNTESPLETCLVQGISRGERMDYTIQKATELGVSQIQPVYTEHCEVKLGDKAEKRRQQWQAIAISACEQSGRVRVPEILAPIELAEYLKQQVSPQPDLVLDPFAKNKIADLPADFIAANTSTEQAKISFIVGPEGGLSEQEVAAARAAKFLPIQLGPRILRTETVAPVILSLLQQQFGDF